MKNIKSIALYLIFMIVVQPSIIGMKAMGQVAVETAVAGGNQILNDHLPKAGQIVTDVSAKLGVEAAKIGAETVNNAVKVGAETVNNFAPAINLVAAAVAVSQVYTMGSDIAEGVSSRYWPNEAQKAKTLKINKEYEFLSTEKALKSCLVQNAQSARGASGLPSACQASAQAFGMAAGHKSLKSITKTFTAVFGEY